jgi:hypothetical protein
VRIAVALGLIAAMATALCPLRICFGHEEARASGPAEHSHEGHEGPDRDEGCCVDVPTDAGVPFTVAALDLPSLRIAAPVLGPRTPTSSAPEDAPRSVPRRSTVLLR